jgi:hypothetical protein
VVLLQLLPVWVHWLHCRLLLLLLGLLDCCHEAGAYSLQSQGQWHTPSPDQHLNLTPPEQWQLK